MSFDEMMQELKQEYLAALPAKIADIENHFFRHDFIVLREDFHKLKGTGSTYGIPEISEIGAVVEKICLDCPEQIEQALPSALELLREIHLARAHRQIAIILDGDPRFWKIRSLVSTEK